MGKHNFNIIKLQRKVTEKNGFIVPHLVKPIKIAQGNHGPLSHLAFEWFFENKRFLNDDSYSVDFEVPFGTTVIAAKQGIVKFIMKSNRFYGGENFEDGMGGLPTYIIVSHRDCFSLYSHLKEIEQNISKGVKIEQGQPIAKTGKTGWIGSIPHLHFEVYEMGKYGTRLSQPIRFQNYSGPLEHKALYTESI